MYLPVSIDNSNSNYPQSDSNLFKSSAAINGQANNSFKGLPFVFVPNAGQVNPKVCFYTSVAGLGIFLTKEEIMLSFIQRASDEALQNISPTDLTSTKFQGMAIALRPLSANRNVKIESMNQGSGKVNYLNGNDPVKWYTNLPVYGKIAYKELWEGIDLTLYEENGQLKYEFIVHPGARHEDIRLSYEGMNDAYIDDNGNLVVDTSLGKIIDKRPVSYQMIHGRRVTVDSGFILGKLPDGKYVHGFKIGSEYDSNYPLVIDPGIYYSTFLGGSDRDFGRGIAVDNRGSAYVTGYTWSSDFPKTTGTSFSGFLDAFVTKLSPDGSKLVYSTFLGGSDTAFGNGIAVDASGSAYVTGSTSSSDFPTTPGAFDTLFNGVSDAFVTKLSPNGNKLVYSTFLGGSASDSGNGIAIDASGNAYVTGSTSSLDFPTAKAFDASYNGGFSDAFVTKLSPDGSRLVYSTFLGGSDNDSGNGIAVGASGNAYVTGQTRSSDFPTTPGAFDTSFNSLFDAFVTKLSPDGRVLEYSTFLGGEFGSDFGQAIYVDASGSAYVTGSTLSEDFPTTPGAFSTLLNGISDAFITKLSPDGRLLVYSTFLGGSNRDFGNGIAVDTSGRAYITGGTDSSDFPTTPGAFETLYSGNRDAFVTKLSSDGSSLIYSTFLGGSDIDSGSGIAIDASGNAYVTGDTASEDFPTTPGAFDISYNGGIRDAFVTKLATTPQGQISILLAEIQALVSQGVLNRGQGISLTTPLNAALTQFNRGNCSLAVIQLNSFIARVAAFERAGILTAAQSQELISEAERTIDFINYLCSESGGLEEAILKARTEQVHTLINNLGSSDYFTREAATEELGRRIKEEPGSVIADYIKVTADMNNSEVRWRAEILLDIQIEKEQLACLNKQLGNINYSIQDLVVQRQRLQDSISQEQSRYNNKPGSSNTVI